MARYEVDCIPGDRSLADAFAVRRTVFIEEQGVPESIEMDGKDEAATHFLITDATKDRPVGTARLRVLESAVAKPERVAIVPDYRGKQLGRLLMGLVESAARVKGCSRAVLHAQTRVENFYESLAYERVSDEFEEAGIPHVEMEKRL